MKEYYLLLLLICFATTSCAQNRKGDQNIENEETTINKYAHIDTFFMNLSDAAISIIDRKIIYDATYVQIPYPNGDVSPDRGVCTDVVIRAYRKLGIDIQEELHEDIKANFSEYPNKKTWGLNAPDTNIDHRRVPNLQVFFSRKGKEKPITMNPEDYLPGDIVTWLLPNGMTHIGIVVAQESKSDKKTPLIVHNIGGGQVLQNCLFAWKITGHYSYRK